MKMAAMGEQRITLECGRSKFKLLGLPRDEFPTFPQVRFHESWRVRSADLQKLISHTSFAVSTEESRPILNGVLWELRPERMRMVATNGHRLTRMDLPVTSVGAPGGDLIVPPKALEQVRRLFPAEEDLEIAQGDNHFGFRSPFTAVFTRLIEGPYPNYEQVIPRDNDRVAISDKVALIKCVEANVGDCLGSDTPYSVCHLTADCCASAFRLLIWAKRRMAAYSLYRGSD